MRRRDCIAAAGVTITSIAGCIGGGSEGSDDGGEDELPDAFKKLEWTEKGGEFRLECTVTEDVAEVTAINSAGEGAGSVTYDAKQTKGTIFSSEGTVRGEFEFTAWDEDENELGSVTRSFKPDVTISNARNFAVEQGLKNRESDDDSLVLIVDFVNEGTAPVAITGTPILTAGWKHVGDVPENWGAKSMQHFWERSEIPATVLPGESEYAEVWVYSRFENDTTRLSMSLKTANDEVWVGGGGEEVDLDSLCAPRDLTIRAWDNTGKEYEQTVRAEFTGDPVYAIELGDKKYYTCTTEPVDWDPK